ncbi:MAG: MptD family putative ECF transporter S component [Mobiluncus porci]|uniref:MptD family putative ECF transporter S component n=1 Tax=Mobiluncus porci TaxID=2652278 RepID=A0A7K0K4X2_9ACTO|nr:MptD family putative ECF transporter S component [Mobiluncus porci]MDD7542165.1 MptD family putative ECF transporter S component [Mobiluncus porci]MDY5747897.1 MptD family putative ECF transporter S component [Mobiluncus porci]MST50522.1 MptD family putative ECF transporter S component [Mobiluncus porci]
MTEELARPSRFAFSVRDLINIGIFLVLYLITSAANALAALGPQWIYLALVVSAPLGGIVFELFLTRVNHPGMIFVFGIIFGGAISMIHGWQTIILVVICSVLAELMVWVGRYRSRRLNLLSYPVFQLWSMGPLLPIMWNAEAYKQMLITEREKTAAYADAVVEFSTNPLYMSLIVGGIVVFAFLGAWFGQVILKKHFEKAGIA